MGSVMKDFMLGSWDTDLFVCGLKVEPSRN